MNSENIQAAVGLLGDKWTILILWASLNGVSRFGEYRDNLGIARNILTIRLQRLVDLGLLEKRPVREGSRLMGYHPTPEVEGLRPVFDALVEFADAEGG